GPVNTPRPSAPKRPTTGGSESPVRLLAQESDHSSVAASYRRRVTPPKPSVGKSASSMFAFPSSAFHERWTPGNSYHSSLPASARRSRRCFDDQKPTNQSKRLSIAAASSARPRRNRA